ncbi:MAG: hypothetical protein GX444_06455 [Myxococcales bacterium]|nr:hypothetical protein [Myxococcales bacterium]
MKKDFLKNNYPELIADLYANEKTAWEDLYHGAQSFFVGAFINKGFSEEEAFDLYHDVYLAFMKKMKAGRSLPSEINSMEKLVQYLIGIGKRKSRYRRFFLHITDGLGEQFSEDNLLFLAEDDPQTIESTIDEIAERCNYEQFLDLLWQRLDLILINYPNQLHNEIFHDYYYNTISMAKLTNKYKISEANARKIFERIKKFLMEQTESR